MAMMLPRGLSVIDLLLAVYTLGLKSGWTNSGIEPRFCCQAGSGEGRR